MTFTWTANKNCHCTGVVFPYCTYNDNLHRLYSTNTFFFNCNRGERPVLNIQSGKKKMFALKMMFVRADIFGCASLTPLSKNMNSCITHNVFPLMASSRIHLHLFSNRFRRRRPIHLWAGGLVLARKQRL